MKVGFDLWFMFGIMNGDRYGGLKIDVMEVLKDERGCVVFNEGRKNK